MFGATWIATRTPFVALPSEFGWLDVLGVSLLAGIGFTVSLFLTELSFVDPARVNVAKTAILAASVVAGAGGYAVLSLSSRGRGTGTSPSV